jgi:internalin A
MAIKVFVSSTYVDLKDHRQRVIAQLRKADYHVDPMEDWTSDADEPRQFSLDRLNGCQACVLLVGFRRGFVPAGQDRSITQMEYDRAIERGIDVLPFLLDDGIAGWPGSYDDRRSDPSLQAWREYLGLHHGVERFTADPTSVEVLPALSRWRERQYKREQVQDYLASIRTAHGTIRFLGLSTFQDNQDVRIDRLFVEPHVSDQPLAPERDPTEWYGRRPLREAVAGDHRLVILGDPGSGKSTLVDWLAWQLADAHQNAWKTLLGSRIPVPLILRDLRLTRGVTWDGLLDAFLAHPIGRHLSRPHLLTLMDQGHTLVMLDGLDEVGDLQVRRDLRDAVQDGLQRFGQCPSLFTSRVVGYDDVPFHLHPDTLRMDRTLEAVGMSAPDPFAALAHIAPFDDPQIAQFARNWYAAREANAERAREGAEHLVQAVRRDRDTLRLARVPNLLTMMALIHRNRATLPNGKALLYEDIAQAYLKTIDEFRHIAEFTDSLQDMKRWLGEVGFKLQQRRREDRDAGQAIVIGGDTLRGWLAEAMAGTGESATADDVRRFLDIIKRRSGLMIERGDNQFAFTHLSFQEYFAAVYLADWVTSAEWLMGEEVPPGTAAAELQRYAADIAWEETLVFLFELLAGEKPLGKKKVREAVFGPGYSVVTGPPASRPQAAGVLARLTSDPHVGWDAETQAAAVDRCLAVLLEYHQTADITSDQACRFLLRPLFSGEATLRHERLQRLADRWAVAGLSRLKLIGAPVTDPSPLAGLSGLTSLSLDCTGTTDLTPLTGLTGLTELMLADFGATDLTPLAGLTGLTELLLVGSGATDLTPLAGFTGLRTLGLVAFEATDLTPLAGLTGLTELALVGSGATDLTPLAGLTGLTELVMLIREVTDFTPLAGLTGLRTLSLGSEVTDLTPLAGLSGLTNLTLKDTRINRDEVAKLKTRLPGLNVRFTRVPTSAPSAAS